MKTSIQAACIGFTLIAIGLLSIANAEPTQPENPLVDFAGFLLDAKAVANTHDRRRISVEDFVRMSRQEGTVILDTRSKAAFHQKHLVGAVHLNFSDITKDALENVIPSKDTRILIYCNNNFENNSPAFPSKAPAAALNIPTFITLHTYGYRNVYQLAPMEDEGDTILEFESGE